MSAPINCGHSLDDIMGMVPSATVKEPFFPTVSRENHPQLACVFGPGSDQDESRVAVGEIPQDGLSCPVLQAYMAGSPG